MRAKKKKKKKKNPLFSHIFARAKRGRVVQSEYEKSNRRPDRPTDPTRHPKFKELKFSRWALIYYLKIDDFSKFHAIWVLIYFLKMDGQGTPRAGEREVFAGLHGHRPRPPNCAAD